jgi:beta-galactosidase
MKKSTLTILLIPVIFICLAVSAAAQDSKQNSMQRQRISINEGWSFFKYESISQADKLIYDVRPEITDNSEYIVADAKPTEALEAKQIQEVLKPWILPSGNKFISEPQKRHIRPEGNPGSDFPFVQGNFDDSGWEKVNLPHDWAIKGPFQSGAHPEVGGGMGRLPVNGVAWYRKKLDIPATDAGKSVFLDIDGAMSYSIVWLNGNLGWRLALRIQFVPARPHALSCSGWRKSTCNQAR